MGSGTGKDRLQGVGSYGDGGTGPVLLYITQVYADDLTGQGTTTREHALALWELARQRNGAVEVIMARRPGAPPPDGLPPGTRLLPLDKSTRLGYLVHQARLLMALAQAIWRSRRQKAAFYVRYNPAMIAPLLLALLTRARLVVRTGPVLPNLYIHGKRPGRLLLWAVRVALGLYCRRASAVVVATPRIRRWVEETYPFTRGRVVVVPNGANTALFRPLPPDRPRWGLPPDAFVLGFVGHIYEDQGLDTVLRALALLRGQGHPLPWLLVVGDGPCLGEWKGLAGQLGVADRVIWAGRIPHREVPEAISAFDLGLAPFTRRAFAVTGSSALKLFEYLACDRPVLASRAEDHLFLEREGVGWLVEPEDPPAWAEAIRGLYHRRPLSLGGRGRRLVLASYTYEAIARRLWSLCFPEGAGREEGDDGV